MPAPNRIVDERVPRRIQTGPDGRVYIATRFGYKLLDLLMQELVSSEVRAIPIANKIIDLLDGHYVNLASYGAVGVEMKLDENRK